MVGPTGISGWAYRYKWLGLQPRPAARLRHVADGLLQLRRREQLVHRHLGVLRHRRAGVERVPTRSILNHSIFGARRGLDRNRRAASGRSRRGASLGPFGSTRRPRRSPSACSEMFTKKGIEVREARRVGVRPRAPRASRPSALYIGSISASPTALRGYGRAGTLRGGHFRVPARAYPRRWTCPSAMPRY